MQNAAGKQHTMSELTSQEIKVSQENRVEINDPVACSPNKVKLIMTERCSLVQCRDLCGWDWNSLELQRNHDAREPKRQSTPVLSCHAVESIF